MGTSQKLTIAEIITKLAAELAEKEKIRALGYLEGLTAANAMNKEAAKIDGVQHAHARQ